MKVIARSLVVIFVAVIAVPVLAITQTVTTAVQLLAATTTALIMGGTQHPLSTPPDSDDFVIAYMGQAESTTSSTPWTPGFPTTPYERRSNKVAVIYPAEFFPVFGSSDVRRFR